MSSRFVSSDEAGYYDLPENRRTLDLNNGVQRFEQNHFEDTFPELKSQSMSSEDSGYYDLPENRRTLNLNNEVQRSERKKGENHEPNRMNPQQPVLDVAPLNCVPYMGPTNPDDMFSSPTKENTEGVKTIGPAMIFLPSQSTKEELDNILAATKNGVALTGAAATGSMGPVVGKVDIGELEDSYYFRVSVPGVSMDKRDFSCDIAADGKVLIKGISTTGEKVVCKNFQIFHMLTQNLCPPGPFTVSFQLPGPVKNLEATTSLADGMFEAIVKKM